MNNTHKTIIVLIISTFSVFSTAFSQDLGATFCWQNKEIEGGHYRYNQSIVKRTILEKEWWENMVEEIDYADGRPYGSRSMRRLFGFNYWKQYNHIITLN